MGDIIDGKYSLAKYLVKWKNGEEIFHDVKEATKFAEEKSLREKIDIDVYGIKDGIVEDEPFFSCGWEI